MSEPSSPFVHLHVHTQYSLLDGAIRLDALLKQAKEYRMDSVAITDHGTMFGAIEFFEKANKAGIKPVIGCECYLAPRRMSDKTPQDSKGTSHLVLLAKDQEGWVNLCKLASMAQLQGFYYKPRIDKEALKAHSGGLIALSACLHGEIPRLLAADRVDDADQAARFYLETFGEGNFYLEVQNNGIVLQEQINQQLRDMGNRLSIPLVASNDCHYLASEDARAHEVLLCIQTGKTIQDPNRFRFGTDQLYFKSPDEMQAYFAEYPGAISNTLDIASRCNIDFDFKTYHFPKYDACTDRSVDDLFEEEVRAGYARRMEAIRAKNPDLDETEYLERLDYEIKVIKDMGFPAYFLIVGDFIRYAKENGVPVGPGRGSAAGSIVAYSMGITDLDPIEHGLIFERFLNPARISMPDIDVDFCINGREKVFKYVVERYGGGDFVSQIITYGKLKTRAVIRDVGRALDIPLRDVDTIAKMVPDVLNISLEDALDQEPRIGELADSRPEIAELIRICRTLEGLPRHASTHAAGVVISDKPLVEYLPLFRGKNGETVTQFDMKYVEKIGLVKFDFLGLRNLTVIDRALELMAEQGKTPPDMINLPLDDQASYDLLCSGDTTGVFQLESSGMKDLLVRLRPASFADITALVALYRPGPMGSGMVDDFVERKHGRKAVEYPLSQLEPILEETYGVILYQEQVMKIAGALANYSMAEADGLRKAMGKKIQELMIQHRKRFAEGAKENNIPEEKATYIFDLMEKFGGYGFNKSHSAAYALIAYQTAYLKAHYPVEFLAALLTSEQNNSDGVVKFIAECRSHNIPVLPPDINESFKEFTVSDQKIRFGLVAVKNVGEGAIDAIVDSRKEGRFASLYDFCERVELRKVNKRVIEGLIRCGAFDSTGDNRSSMMASLEEALDHGQRVQKEKADPQMGLFDMGGKTPVVINQPTLVAMEEWDDRQRLTYEKESLGFYVSGHPLDAYASLIDRFANTNALSIHDISDGRAVRIGGMIQAMRTIKTKKGDLMAFVTVEDMGGSVEVVVFSSVYSSVCDLLVEDNTVFVQGQVQQEESGCKILADMIIPMEKAEETWTAEVHLTVDADRTERDTLVRLKSILAKYPGSCRAFLHLKCPGKAETILALPANLNLSAGSPLSREVNGLLGYPAVETVCSAATLSNVGNDRNGRKGFKRHA